MSATVLLTAALALMGPPTTSKGSSTPSVARAPHCILTIIDEAQVPAKEPGELMTVSVREGSRVKAGQELARIDDQVSQTKKVVAELDFQAAEAQATNNIRIEAAEAGAEVAQAEYDRSLETNRREEGTISESQLRKEELSAKHAKLQTELAKHEYTVAGLTAQAKQAHVDAAELEIRHRQIVAPIDGVVTQMAKHKGEWVQPGDPLLRIVRMDKLRVEGFLNSDEFAPIDVADRPVTVVVKLAGGRVEKFTGTLEFVSVLVEASGEYRIWAEVENRLERGHWVLRPGMPAEMSIELVPAE